eukprot:scaffold3363_cov285-Prasinococcus_capsulatus_cf.AAC.5
MHAAAGVVAEANVRCYRRWAMAELACGHACAPRRGSAAGRSELEGAALGSTLDRALGGDLPFTKFALAEP